MKSEFPPRSAGRFTPAFLTAVLACTSASASAQIDEDINREVWQRKFGVLDAQMADQAPYGGWMDQDADGDGVSNRQESIAGTNPFHKLPAEPHFRTPAVQLGANLVTLSIPTVEGKFYSLAGSQSLSEAWNQGIHPAIAGDGTVKSFVVPKSAGRFFQVSVTDRSTSNDTVSDWAKIVMGFSPSAPLATQSSYNAESLANALVSQDVVRLEAIDTLGVQPADAATAASDIGVIRISRSGNLAIGSLTIPITRSGTAVEGVDVAPLPSSVVLQEGVTSVDLKIIPLHNPSRSSGATVSLTAMPPGTPQASGSFSLGSPVSAGVTLLPPGNASGTGLSASYWTGSSSTYSNPINFGGVTATYTYTRSTTTTGFAIISFTGTPAVPFTAGNQAYLQFTSGSLNTAPFSSAANYTIVSPTTSSSFRIDLTGSSLPTSGSGNLNLGNFTAPLTRIEPTIDFVWLYGSPNGSTYVGGDNHSVVWEGNLAPSTSGSYTFQLDADDKARVLLDTGAGLVQILENGWDTPATGGFKSSAPISLSVPATPGARYPIRVEFSETTGASKCRLQWRLNSGSFANIPSTNVWRDRVSTNTADNVWVASYYNNPTFTEPAARVQTETAVTSTNNGDWGTGVPDPSLPLNNFSARWSGQILPQYSQTYYFTARVDDAVRLWVNNQLIVDRWPGGGATDRVGSIDLQAGVLYDIRMDYSEATGSAEARLYWHSDDQAKQIIPMNRLFPTNSGKPAITSPLSAVALVGASSPFSMSLSSSNGGVITASGLPSWLSLINGVLSGTPPSAGIYQFTLTTNNASGSGSAVMTLEVQDPPDQLTRELWTTGVTGASLASVPWASPPNSTGVLASAEDSSTLPANTGVRIRGYFTAERTGNHYFWLASSNNAQLWISNDDEPVNKVLRASVSGGTGPRTWNTNPSQKSAWISLVAGKRYYLEILHNSGSAPTNHLSAAWFLDPTGTTANPIVNGCPPGSAAAGGILPGHILSPWDNPPTTTIPGTLYVTNLQGLEGLTGITATGGAFLRVNGSSAVLQLDFGGLSSGVTSKRVIDETGATLFDLTHQDHSYPALKTSDGGYSWNLSPTALTALAEGRVRILVCTVNHPGGEIFGTFGRTAGSQTAPATPASPSWTSEHATSDAANSRFLSQATFGPSPAHMAEVKASGYRAWIDNQFTLPSTRNIPFVLANLSNDPQNPYGNTLMFNSWWKNSVTAPDQLRQRTAFALSEILVVSDTGPLNNNGRALADYYDTLLENCFGNYRDILKQVTLSPAMGVYLDMRGNEKGDISTGRIPNENYAREILQLFSTGLYRLWPDGTLAIDSSGRAVPSYDQPVVSGFARVFTGWTWGQPMSGGRLPTSFSPSSNHLDPMVLVPTRHELGSKIILDNVVLPPATVTSSSDTATDPSSTLAVQTTDPVLGAGNTVTTTITNRYDLNGLRDLEAAIDNIMANSSTAPYICRQLIQRLVTSHPKPEYVHRVVLAFNGERNVDGIATGVRGDMKEVLRAILLDREARDPAAAADVKFGKQREHLLRVTGPARAFPAATIPNSTYRQLGIQSMLITTPVPHLFVNGESVRLSDFVDSGGNPAQHPTTGSYSVANSTPAYSFATATATVTLTAPGYQAGDSVPIRFTSGTLGSTSPYNTVQTYTVQSATPTNFTISLPGTGLTGTPTGSAHTPYHFTIQNNATSSLTYNNTGSSVVISSAGYAAGDQLYLKFVTGGLSGGSPSLDGIYTIASATASNFTVNVAGTPANSTGTVLVPRLTGGYSVSNSSGTSSVLFQTSGGHNLVAGDQVQIKILLGNPGTAAQSGVYTVASVPGPNSFRVSWPTVISSGSQGSGGSVVLPLKAGQWTRSGTTTLDPSTWNAGNTDSTLIQTPLDSTTVFNFFYPDYQFPGEMARAGMTTPEFQLTNDSNTMTLTNTITQGSLTNNGGSTSTYLSFFGGSAVTLDISTYLTAAQTTNAAIPALVDSLGNLLTGGNLSASSRSSIIAYVANTTNFPLTTPTPQEIRNRVRAIIHLIVTSSDYAIQK